MNKVKMLNLLNTSGQEELTQLAGIGPALAQRIIAGRPYKSLEALTTVKGVNSKMVENWLAVPAKRQEPRPAPGETPVVTALKENISGPASVQSSLQNAKDVIAEKMSELGESVKKGGKAVQKTAEELTDKFEQESKTRGTVWTLLVSNGITALVSILLTLIILGVINGSLKYATGSQYRSLRSEITSLSNQAVLIQQDQESLRGRVDTLEGLGERIVGLENAQQQLAADLEITSQQVGSMQSEVETLSGKVEQQEERTLRFETFLKELQTLLASLFAQGETK
jgi:chromosome segregation ATPase